MFVFSKYNIFITDIQIYFVKKMEFGVLIIKWNFTIYVKIEQNSIFLKMEKNEK